MLAKTLYVYILSNPSRQLYVGVTNSLQDRVQQHRGGMSRYTREHNITTLVYCEVIDDQLAAIAREKQIKSWTRMKRVALIEKHNPNWRDLSSSTDGSNRTGSIWQGPSCR